MNNIFTLRPPVRPVPVPEPELIQPGFSYRLHIPPSTGPEQAKDFSDASLDVQAGLVGNYRPGIHSAAIEAADLGRQPVPCFVWDADLLSPGVKRALQVGPEQPHTPHNNVLTLLNESLEGPEVRLINDHPTLTIAPRFNLEWVTQAYASQLGLIQLVESLRTLQFADGESLVLLDTEAAGVGPVLYLNDEADTLAVKPVCAFQPQGARQCFDFTTEIKQIIPAEFEGKAVESISVLEKYTYYFMQNAAPDDPDRHIWVPVYLPIVWGWSIRVQQRSDGEWAIFRKKLIMPMPTTEAAALPLWQSNSLRCRRRADV